MRGLPRWRISLRVCHPLLVVNFNLVNDFDDLATLEDFQRLISVNTLGTFLCYKYAAQEMIKQGRGGRIIGASSLLGKQGQA